MIPLCTLWLRYPSQRTLFSTRLKIGSSKKCASEQLDKLLGVSVVDVEWLMCPGFGVFMTGSGEQMVDHKDDVASCPIRRSQRVQRRPSQFLESDEESIIVDAQEGLDLS